MVPPFTVMRVASSLTNRIFLACTLVAMLSLGSAFVFVNQRATTDAEADLRRGVTEATALVDQNRLELTATFTRLASLVADLPKLKAAVETGDPPTVQPLADEYRAQIRADLLVLTGRLGTPLASSGSLPPSLPPTVGDVTSTAPASLFWTTPTGVLQIVSVPVLLDGQPPDILGRLTVGFAFDSALAGQFKRLTGSEVAFGVDGHIVASTLPAAAGPALARLMGRTDVATTQIGDQDYVAVSRPLLAPGESAAGTHAGTPVALILRSRTERLQVLGTIRAGLAGALVLTLLAATLISYAVARTVAQPLSAITSAMRDVAATGDLTRKVQLQSRPWDDEDARLLASAFNTLTDSIARFQSEAAQKERLSSLGRLSTVIAHEVRNPLMIIKASLRSLAREGASAADRREAVADIDEETTRLNRIVSEVLDFAKPIRFDIGEASLNDVCRTSAGAAWAGEPDAELVLDLDPGLPAIQTDAERLRTALVNILTNARNAVRVDTVAGGSGTGRVAVMSEPLVHVRTSATAGFARIVIRDRGVGIAPEDLSRIFDPYFTTRRAGTGLGLPIARNIIEGLGGTLSISSLPGEGTEVRIDLPRFRPQGSA